MRSTFRCISAMIFAVVLPVSGSEADRARAVAFAQATQDSGTERHEWCGTSEVTSERQKALARWVSAKQRAESRRSGTEFFGAPVRFENGMFIMQSDASVAPYDRPVDLK